jgi:hypothetical protein
MIQQCGVSQHRHLCGVMHSFSGNAVLLSILNMTKQKILVGQFSMQSGCIILWKVLQKTSFKLMRCEPAKEKMMRCEQIVQLSYV